MNIGAIVQNKQVIDDIQALFPNPFLFSKSGNFDNAIIEEYMISVGRIQLDLLIISLESIAEENSFLRHLKNYRIQRPDTHIIVIAIDRVVGDPTIAKIISMGIYDIISPSTENIPEDEELDLTFYINERIKTPATYADAARWHTEVEEIKSEKNIEKKKEDKISKNPSISIDEEELLDFQVPVREKLIIQERLIGSICLSITGVNRNVGTTHTALLIANYLARNGNQVAIIEANDSKDFSKIEYVYEGMKGYVSSTHHFSIGNVEYFKSINQVNMIDLMGKYNYIIFDLGWNQESAWFDEFFRSHIQIIVGAGSEWKQGEIYQFSRNFQSYEQSNWIYCVPFVQDVVIKDIKKELINGKVYRLPAHPDPYESDAETDEFIEEILEEFLIKKKTVPSYSKYILFASIAVFIILTIIIAIMID